MENPTHIAGLALILSQIGQPVLAAGGTDADWPCIQRRTGELSAGVMWPAPLGDAATDTEADDLAARLALRRVSEDEAKAAVDAYATAHPGLGPDALGAIFQAAFTRIDRDRTRVLDGISRYGHKQAALAERIDAAHAEMTALKAVEEPDFDRMDALEEQIDWDERIYKDRERALTYVCETPVLLEKRAYSVAQMLLRHLP
ncbi:MAG: hypothetical protein WBB85_17670 [Albidovulum sp.]|uniref:hypothetical protein n=1 Tax=Albidovulum sp. TaxID=1872424 RepID=UPI003C8BC2F9